MRPSVQAETMTLSARDGYPLACTMYRPADSSVDRVVIVASATAVRRSFYEPYARYLAGNGCAALTFDYRGIGGSLTGPIERTRATIRDWGEKDYAAIIDFARAQYPDKKVQAVGHSVGGQLVGMMENATRLDAVCTVAAQNGYWRLYPWRQALAYGALWHVGMPLLSWIMSYFPAKKLKLGENLPKGVALEWARFARNPNYMIGPDGEPLRAGFESFRGPVLAYSFDDDERAPEACVRALHRSFTKTDVEFRHVRPSALGAKSIGHVGFFFAKFKDSLWRDSLSWLRAN